VQPVTEKLRSMIESDINFEKSGVQLGSLRIPHSVHRSGYGHIVIPIAVIKNDTGPTVLLTGGVHGDEYEGPVALSKLVQKLNSEDVRGRIIVIPALNYPAFKAASRVSPIDDINLNRTFPGKRDGTVTEMIAHYVTTELLPITDYLFDFHSGGSSLNYLPCVLAPLSNNGAESEKVAKLLDAFSPARVLRYDSARALSGETRVIGNYAMQNGVIFLTGEFGGGATVNVDGLQSLEAGLMRYLIATGVLNDAKSSQAEIKNEGVHPIFESFMMDDPGLFAFANKSGLFEPAFRLGDKLEAGDIAGFIYNTENPWEKPTVIRFASAGVALCIRTFALVEPGDCLGHLGRVI